MPKYKNGLSPKQERFIQEYQKNGGNATQAVLDAGYKCKNKAVATAIGVENLVKTCIAGPLAVQKAEIRAKTGITVENQQLALLSDIEAAREAGRWGAVMSGHATLLKSIGGMTGDRPHPDSMAGKELDARKMADLRAIADRYYNERYLAAKPIESITQATGCPLDAPERPTIDEPNPEGKNVQGQEQTERSGQTPAAEA